MAFKYQPQGIIVSSSLAIKSGFAKDFISGPATASTAEYAELGPIGPTGSIFKILTGSTTPVVP